MLRIGQVENTAQNGKYTDGNVAGGVAATRLRAAAFNAIQEELANIVESAGMQLSVDDMTQVLTALKKLFLSRSNPFADIKSDGAAAVAMALSNLGLGNLGTAAKKDVGTGPSQIPDMSFWTTGGDANNGWRKSPDGLIEQWGRVPVSSSTTVPFIIPFPNEVHTVMATGDPNYSNGIEVAQAWPWSTAVFSISGGWITPGNVGATTNMTTLWRAWGR
ncbi:hypothetical protein RI049_09825 [Cedecea neteri]|uniref:gp53-like domain-containing protein n=1 Tax=Cedecea neteri TaxID=158822 RepID=UPI002AA83ED2|nr:hypothetical protein [Cedecea neteri]WPU25010.1 hypothetical protein RI049_09825 [Cedecea neteri]